MVRTLVTDYGGRSDLWQYGVSRNPSLTSSESGDNIPGPTGPGTGGSILLLDPSSHESSVPFFHVAPPLFLTRR